MITSLSTYVELKYCIIQQRSREWRVKSGGRVGRGDGPGRTTARAKLTALVMTNFANREIG